MKIFTATLDNAAVYSVASDSMREAISYIEEYFDYQYKAISMIEQENEVIIDVTCLPTD